MPPRIRLSSCLLTSIRRQPTQFTSVLPPASSRCASILSALSDNPAAYNKRIRRGRGPASGKGKTSGRGQKGQHAHGKVPAGFEGGQTPLSITNPPRGREKYNPFKVEMSPINLDRIQSWIDQGRLDPKKPITMKELKKSRCLHGVKKNGVKVLARNAEQLTSKIHIIVSRASKEAIARIEALGGSVTTRFYSPTSIKRVLRGDSHPVVSMQASSALITLAAKKDRAIASSTILSALKEATAAAKGKGDGVAVDRDIMATIIKQVGQKYKYRLPDATSRKDIEYYRDPAHRGYLAYTIKQGETPSLYWKLPRKRKSAQGQGQGERKLTAKEREENKLF